MQNDEVQKQAATLAPDQTTARKLHKDTASADVTEIHGGFSYDETHGTIPTTSNAIHKREANVKEHYNKKNVKEQ